MREQAGWSQEAFALKAGLDRTYVSGIERGTRNVGVLNVYRLAAALGTHPRELFLTEADAPGSEPALQPKQILMRRNRPTVLTSP